MAIVKVGDINIYYEVHGEGEPLVLIMGYGAHSGWWYRMVPEFSQDYRVVVFDNRGCGRSDKPSTPYTMKMMAGDLAGLLDTISIEATHVFGVSMGGMIAQHFALSYPEKVKTLILGCTMCGGTHCITPTSEAMSALFDLERMQKQTPEERGKELLPFLFTQEFISNNMEIIQQFAKKVMEYITPLQGYLGQAAAIRDHDTYERLPEIRVPALVVAGDADRLIPVENSRMLASRIPNSELVILKNAGHGFQTEAEEETKNVVLDFLRRYRGDN